MCRECRWIEVSKFVFPDKTKSVVCSKCDRFLGFTEVNGEIKIINEPFQCKYKELKRVRAY